MNNLVENLLDDARELLPHGEGIQLVEEVVEFSEDSVICTSREVAPESFCFRDSSGELFISTMSFVEYIAQAAAIGKIYTAQKFDRLDPECAPTVRRGGAVVRARGFDLVCDYQLPQVTKFYINASWSPSVAGAFEVSGELSLFDSPDRPISSGRLTIVEFE